ncbi:hypothetical protein M426DRAFT_320725 [Hypoxylon sp. CI-4A]|nr:hypothetical protein M426DRAFT_320725 [Hypoxylon sp. CI-4A]
MDARIMGQSPDRPRAELRSGLDREPVICPQRREHPMPHPAGPRARDYHIRRSMIPSVRRLSAGQARVMSVGGAV